MAEYDCTQHDKSGTASPSADSSLGAEHERNDAYIIASTPCSCVGVGDQHNGIVRLFEVV